MPGAEAAIREPWRMAVGHLSAAGIDVESAHVLEMLGASVPETRVLKRMIERQVNSPYTSSLGRLFDAVAALVLHRRKVEYEAQAAIELEGIAIDEPYAIDFHEYLPLQHQDGDQIVLNVDALWSAILHDLRRGVSAGRIAAKFHSAIAEGFIAAVESARDRYGIQRVALSGGCMHNRRLATLLREGLEKRDFKVYRHLGVSPGDGGLSYGQASVAAAILRNAK